LSIQKEDNRLIKGIIFDLCGTLVQFTGDWLETHRRGAAALADWYVKKKHIKLDAVLLAETFLAEFTADRRQADETQTEVLAQVDLLRALAQLGAPPAATAGTEAALKIFFEPEEALWQPFPDAITTLKQLSAKGYRLGLYSNAPDDPLVQRVVNRSKLRPWLAPVFSSAGLGWRKPRPEPLRLIADRWGLPPAEIAVVGDTLNADILGAQAAGMTGILVTTATSFKTDSQPQAEPTAIIEQLAALVGLVEKL